MQYPYTLPALPYAYTELEPSIDAKTMEIHHTKHHQTYVDKLNAGLEAHPDLQAKSLEELLRGIETLPEAIRSVVQNHGGGHHNHSLFWESLSPTKTEPSELVSSKLTESFGSIEAFQEQLTEAATTRFGSGWGWLVQAEDGTLKILSTANQDSPLMQGMTPVLGVDVWEHAYYLKYQNRRPEYIQAWWNCVNWGVVESRMK